MELNTAVVSIAVPILATIAAVASAVAAWRSHAAARDTLLFQKKLARHQESLFLLRSTIESLWLHKRVLSGPLDASDGEFQNILKTHLSIKRNLGDLIQSNVLLPRKSKFFDASSVAEIVDQLPAAAGEIEKEIQRLQAKINEIFA